MIQMDKERQPGIFYTASISGGKDSICMGILLLEKGYPVDDFIFFDLGVEYPETYEAIAKFEQDTGRKVAVVKPPLGDFWYYACEREYIGKGRFPVKKKGYGFPCMCNRWCIQLKRDAIKAFFRGKGYSNPVQYIGIAADEPKRVRDERNKRYPLVEWGITEANALKFCRDRGYFGSPHPYDTLSRVSCYCCPLARVQSATYLIEQRPELWQNIKDHERAEDVRTLYKGKGTAYFEERLHKKRQVENQQIKMEFDE